MGILRTATKQGKKALNIFLKISLIIAILIVASVTCCNIESSEEDRKSSIVTYNEEVKIAKILVEQNSPSAIDNAQDFCKSYEADSKALKKANDKIKSLSGKKQTEKTMNQLEVQKTEQKKLEERLNSDKDIYVEYSEFLSPIDTSFYWWHKDEIKALYLAHENGELLEELPFTASLWYLGIIFVLLITAVAIALVFIIPLIIRKKDIQKIAELVFKSGDINGIEKALEFVDGYNAERLKMTSLKTKKGLLQNKDKK